MQVAPGNVCMRDAASVSCPPAVCVYRMRGSIVSLLYTTGQRVFSIGRQGSQKVERIKVHGCGLLPKVSTVHHDSPAGSIRTV